MGLVPGNRVLLHAPNSPWLAACWLAVVKAGGIAVTTMPMLRVEELRTIVEMSRISHALCDARVSGPLQSWPQSQNAGSASRHRSGLRRA
jgi:2-aminobenzoate-CoA ligase